MWERTVHDVGLKSTG